jgi:SHS family lactate transporter-like MFS transporter
MQFMVQGAWGVIPAHINELSPDAIRGFFPGFAYQLGVLFASSITYMQARMAEHFTYSLVMGVSMTIVLIVGAIVISLGPERRGVRFGEEASP